MPKIRTYEQQVGLSSGEMQSSASPNTAGAPFRAMAELGGAIAGFGEVLHKNDVQKDITSSYANLSGLRNKFTQRIQAETQAGSINTEKIQQEYQDEINKLTGSVNTREGKQYLERHGATLGSDLTRSAALSQAQVAGKLAVEQWTNSINLNGNTLQQSPADFESVLRESVSALESQVQAGALDRDQAEKLKRMTGEQFADNAVVGWANINADTAKNLLDQGVYDKFLDPDKKQALYSKIKTYKSAEETEVERRKKADEEAKTKISEAWEQENVDNLVNGSLTPKQILDAPLKANRKIQYMNMLKANLKQKLQTDPMVKNSIVQRVLLPDGDPKKILDRSQLYPLVGNGLTLTDLKQITTFMDSTPEGSRMRDNRKRLMQLADSTLVRRDPTTGQPDPQGPYGMSLFTNALMDAEEQMKKEGKDTTLLYDPNSKDYFGNQIFKYKSSSQEIFQRQIDFQGLTVPSGVKQVRGANETAADYLKRLGK